MKTREEQKITRHSIIISEISNLIGNLISEEQHLLSLFPLTLCLGFSFFFFFLTFCICDSRELVKKYFFPLSSNLSFPFALALNLLSDTKSWRIIFFPCVCFLFYFF